MLKPRVLMLEHHRDLRETLVEALLDEGYIVTPAATQQAAFLALGTASEGQLPDVLVLDAQDGEDLLSEVCSDPRYARVGVVTLSFSSGPPTQADVVDVRRPFRLERFLAAVREALAARSGTRDVTPSPPPR